MNTDEIRAALAAATPGPWDATYDPADRWTSITGQQYGEYVCPEVAICEGDVGADAHLIANAPTYIADLLAEVDRLTSAVHTYADKLAEHECEAAAVAELGVALEETSNNAADYFDRALAAEQAVERVRDFAEQGREFADRTMDDAAAHWARSAADGIIRALDGGDPA